MFEERKGEADILDRGIEQGERRSEKVTRLSLFLFPFSTFT
jgi:hypothetical protein